MADREKVIKGLHDIGGFVADRMGIEQARNFIRTIDDAITLLKEQEPELWIITQDGMHCGNCNRRLRYDSQFCDGCVKAVAD